MAGTGFGLFGLSRRIFPAIDLNSVEHEVIEVFTGSNVSGSLLEPFLIRKLRCAVERVIETSVFRGQVLGSIGGRPNAPALIDMTSLCPSQG